MKALIFAENRWNFENVEDPPIKEDELLVQTKAIGINHADLLQKVGKYPPPPGASPILGLEVAGVVEKASASVEGFYKGDRVMCLLAGGGYAEKVAVPKGLCIPVPHNLSFEEAAAIPEAFLTAYQALFLIGELQPQSTVLIHAGGSGVGSAAIQLARSVEAKILATTRSKEKMEDCLDLGALAVINTSEGQFSKKVLEATENHGADLILDFIGASYFEENMESLAKGGAIVLLSTLGGTKLPSFDLRFLMKKWATLTGTTLRNRPLPYKEKLVAEFSKFALSRLESGKIRPVVHKVLPWDQAEEAHLLLEDHTAFGKIILSCA